MQSAGLQAAQTAMATGVYVVYRNAATKQECARVGPSALCFCGHGMGAHRGPDGGRCGGGSKFSFGGGGGGGKSFASPSSSPSSSSSPCACRRFEFVPRRPEEVGEWWLPRRRGFNVQAWRAKCRCGHGHDEHHPWTRRCAAAACGGGCGCGTFSSAFCCVVCEAPWEAHETVAQDERERRAEGKSVQEDFLPLSDSPDLRPLVFGCGFGGRGGVEDGGNRAGAGSPRSPSLFQGGEAGGRRAGLDTARCARRLGCACSACSSSAAVMGESNGGDGGVIGVGTGGSSAPTPRTTPRAKRPPRGQTLGGIGDVQGDWGRRGGDAAARARRSADGSSAQRLCPSRIRIDQIG